MNFRYLFFLALLIISSSSCDESNSSETNEGNDSIIECYKEHYNEEGLDYHQHLVEVVDAMNELGFPINGGKPTDLMEVLEQMVAGTFPKDVNMESEAVYKELRIMTLAACIMSFRYENEQTENLVDQLELIAVYDVNSNEEFVYMANNAIHLLKSIDENIEWIWPLNVHMATLYYTQYWRIHHKGNDDNIFESDTLKDYPPPPPPVAPPPPPPIEVEDEEEEYIEVDLPELEEK